MYKTLGRPIVAVVALLAFAGASLSDASKPPFSLTIVPTFNANGNGSIEMARKDSRDFYVVLTNVSSEPQPIWESWNSWGYQAISFELATSDGKKYIISRGPEGFTRNFPSTFLVAPGEHQVYAIHLDKRWVARPAFPKADEMPITIKAIYELQSTQEASQYKVWIGRVESHVYNFALRQW